MRPSIALEAEILAVKKDLPPGSGTGARSLYPGGLLILQMTTAAGSLKSFGASLTNMTAWL